MPGDVDVLLTHASQFDEISWLNLHVVVSLPGMATG